LCAVIFGRTGSGAHETNLARLGSLEK
jgi:hypothetical protein